MSFNELKGKRKTKSYVQSSVSPSPTTPLSKDVEIQPALSSNVELRSTEYAGRGLWAKEHIRPGSIILSLRPHIAVLSTRNLDQYCSSCFNGSSSLLKRCTQCQIVHYCDHKCQNNDWSQHKSECDALQRWSKAAPTSEVAIPNDAVRCLGRMLWKKQKKGLDSLWSKSLDSLQSHRTSLDSSTYEMHADLAHFLVQYLGASSPADLSQFGINSPTELVDLLSRFITNTFAVTDSSLTPLGVSVSPIVALFNHSCDPNAVIVFPRTSAQEPQMQAISIRPISPGEEIVTSYIDTTIPKTLRQKSLLQTYSFICRCSLCVNPPSIDPRESMWCPRKCGGTCPLPTEENDLTQCNRCRAPVVDTDAVLDAVRVGQQGLDKATDLQFKDPAKALQLTTNLQPILISIGMTPSCHPLLGLARLHQSLVISTFSDPLNRHALDDAIRTGMRVTTGLNDVFQWGHPVIGVALAILGRLLAVDEPGTPSNVHEFPPSGPPRLKLAYDTLLRAREALLIGFGTVNEGGALGKSLRDNIASLEKEIGVFREGVKNVLTF